VKNDDNQGSSIGRRRTLQLLTAGLTATGLAVMVGCKDGGSSGGSGGGGGGAAPAGPTSLADCNALIDDASRLLRKNLQYKPKSDNPDKVCSKCAQFTPEKFGVCGGACKLIPGPVKPVGGCLSFAPIGSDAAATPPKTPT
jgi:hypothetical protein